MLCCIVAIAWLMGAHGPEPWNERFYWHDATPFAVYTATYMHATFSYRNCLGLVFNFTQLQQSNHATAFTLKLCYQWSDVINTSYDSKLTAHAVSVALT